MSKSDLNRQHPIMVVAVEPEDEGILRDLLDSEFCDLHFESKPEAAVAAFVDVAPEILLMAFPEISSAERFYLGLFRLEGCGAAKISHQAIILCHLQESSTAYDLCKKRVFDDYLVFHPLHDPNRIKLSLQQALERHEFRALANSKGVMLSNTSEELGELEGYLDSAIGEGKGIGKNLGKVAEKFAQDADQQSDLLRRMISQLQSDGVIERVNENRLESHLKGMKKSSQKAPESVAEQKLEHWFDDFEAGSKKQVRAIKKNVDSSRIRSILVVEDDDFHQAIYRQVLQKAGFKVFVVGDGNAALKAIHQRCPDLILMDIMLPKLNGIQTTKRILQEPGFADMPIVMVSGYSDKKMVEKAIENGALDYLVKPITANRLLDKIKKHIKGPG